MLLVSTAEDPANPVGELVSTEQPLGLNYFAFAMNPLRLDGIEPRALGRQQTPHYPDPMAAGFDFAVVGGDPASHLMAFMPACVVPDKKQSLLAPLLEPVARDRPFALLSQGAAPALWHPTTNAEKVARSGKTRSRPRNLQPTVDGF